MKKAQGLSLNTMAVAVIVLIVIIVTIAIFTGIVGDAVPFFAERTECTSQTRSEGCKASVDDCEEVNGNAIRGLGCEETTPFCCIKS